MGYDNTWDFPDREAKDPEIYYENKSIPQIRELMEKYNPDIMWFDVPTDISRERSFEILKLIREINPDCIINDRISHEHMDKTLEMGDYYTPEQFIPENLDVNFETCMTLNETWGYVYYDQDWKSAKTIIRNLVTNASMGGNYLLNVGPNQFGEIPFRSVCVLQEAGNWLHVNGESIYGTTRSPLKHVFYDNAASTQGKGKLYIHLFEWPEKDMLVLPEINTEIEGIYFLADREKNNLEYNQNDTYDLLISLNPGNISSEVFSQPVVTLAIEYTGTLKEQQLPPIVDPFNTAVFLPSEAEFSGNIKYDFNNKWGEHRGYELKEWNTGGKMTWDYRTIRKGTYSVELVYGAHELSDDNDIWVSIGGESFKHKIKKYEGWYNELTVILGKVHLEEAMTGKLEVKAGYSNTHVMANFKSVRLVPLDF